MLNHLKFFETHSEYETYINGENKYLPNVSYCEEEIEVHYNPSPAPSSTKVFWRYNSRLDIYALVDANGRLITYYDEPTNLMARCNSDGTFSGWDAAEYGLIEDWDENKTAVFEGSLEGDWRLTIDGETLSYNGVIVPSVTEFPT